MFCFYNIVRKEQDTQKFVEKNMRSSIFVTLKYGAMHFGISSDINFEFFCNELDQPPSRRLISILSSMLSNRGDFLKAPLTTGSCA